MISYNHFFSFSTTFSSTIIQSVIILFCISRKQKRDKECGVTMMFDTKNNTFTRTGSFRQQGITERLERGIDVGPTAKAPPPNPFAIERPHATPGMLQRQGSCRG